MKEIKVGLIGFGTVGKGLAEVLLMQRERLTRRTGMTIRLAGIADHHAPSLPERFSDIPLTKDGMDLINNPDIDIIVELIGGIEVEVDTSGFSNDLVTFREKDDVLTLLIHLGYLAYDKETEKVHIPNEEIKREFSRTIRGVRRNETIQRVRESDQIISDTVHMNADAVAAQIEKIHTEETTALFYNNEQALRSVIKLAYFSYRDYYLKFEELPSGNGYADIVYFPKKTSNLPALVVEMKWDKSAEGAITQIKKRNYPAAIKEFGGEILLVGINYDKDAPAGERKHTCVIEKYQV